jgi:UDP-glucose 4-epimerase
MKRILITGANGFIGRNLAEGLSPFYQVNAPSHGELDLLDEAATRAYLDRGRFDVVIHTANWNTKAPFPKDSSVELQNNLKIFFHLACCRGSYGRLLNLGSGAEYAKTRMRPMVTEDRFCEFLPEEDYGLSKYLMSLYIDKTPDIFNLRLFGVFGPHEDWRIRFISNVLCKALFGVPLSIRQNVVFDYLDVADLVSLISWFIEKDPKHKAYNVCTGYGVDLLTIARTALVVSGKELPITVFKDGYAREYTANNGRLMREMGGFSFLDLKTSMERLYRWYDEHRDIIDRNVLASSK